MPPNTVIPALALFAGSPGLLLFRHCHSLFELINLGRFVEDLPESTQEIVEAQTKQYYTRFQPLEK